MRTPKLPLNSVLARVMFGVRVIAAPSVSMSKNSTRSANKVQFV